MKKLFLSLLCAISSMTIYALNDIVPGFFSVADDKTVAFAQGNLQATTADLGVNWTWGFAEHQYDYVGAEVANTKISGNGKVGENGTVDLFGWSTVANFFGIHYSENPSLYSGEFIEWGKRIGDGWRTLTKDEWVYVFNTRTGAKASTVAETANARYAKATVNSIKGVILFPDGGTFAASEFTTVTALNLWSAAFTTTTCTADQWTALEAKGCVFLPNAGYRLGAVVYSDNSAGFYWSSTPCSDIEAYELAFEASFCNPQAPGTRETGNPVRLVHEQPKVGEKFKAASGDDILQFEVTALAPNLTVRVTETGHILKEGTDLVIPATVKYIGQTFTVTEVADRPQFGNAKTLSLPNSITKKVNWWSADLSSLEAFIVAEDHPIFTVVGGVLYSKDKVTLYRCPAKKAFTSADFQPVTKYLGSNAFYKNTAISDLVIPNTITSTELNTFYASSITSVFIPTSLKGLSNADFGYCAQLASVTFENSAVISIAWDAFNNSKIINDQEGDFKVIDSVAIKYMGSAETVVFPDSIVNIVYSCISYSRAGSKTMTTVILPASIKAVHYQFLSFNSASEKYPLLEKIICKAQDVPNVKGTKLQLNSEKDVTLVVPCGKLSDYTAATMFANPFTTIEEGFVYNVTLKQTEGGTIAYTKKEECNEIELTATPDEGYEFVKWNDDNTDATRIVAVNSDIEFSATFQVKQTGFENVQRHNVQCTKVIRNGQLVILRDGKVFNALGAEMK